MFSACLWKMVPMLLDILIDLQVAIMRVLENISLFYSENH